MKVAIIGAGNMGGAIARGLAQGTIIPASDVTVADPFSGSLETLQADYPEINVTTENPKAIKDADIVILAVKPWLIDQVLKSGYVPQTDHGILFPPPQRPYQASPRAFQTKCAKLSFAQYAMPNPLRWQIFRLQVHR